MSKKIGYPRMDELTHHNRSLIRAELDSDRLQYRCGLCTLGRAFEKLSDLGNHLLVHGISGRDPVLAATENERIFERILLHTELAFPPHYGNQLHSPIETSLTDDKTRAGLVARRQHHQTLSCLAKGRARRS